MAKWDDGAIAGLRELQTVTNSSDADVQALRLQIGDWAEQNPDARQDFAFAPLRMRNARVNARTSGGWITQIDFGEV